MQTETGAGGLDKRALWRIFSWAGNRQHPNQGPGRRKKKD